MWRWFLFEFSPTVRKIVLCPRAPTIFLLVLLRVVIRWSWVWSMVESCWLEDWSRPTLRKLCLRATLSTSNLTWTAPASDRSLHREKPADVHLSYVWKSISYPANNNVSHVGYEDRLVGAAQGNAHFVLWEMERPTTLCGKEQSFLMPLRNMLGVAEEPLPQFFHSIRDKRINYLSTVYMNRFSELSWKVMKWILGRDGVY